MPEFVYGHWAVLETLRANRRPVEHLLVAERTEERGRVAEVMGLARQQQITIKRVSRRILDDVAESGNHQGLVLRVGPYPYVDVDDMLDLAQQQNEKPFILLLDLLQDPQNVGALLRVADSVGVHGVILQERRGVGVTAGVVNASSGAAAHLQIAQVTNLVNTMKALKERDVWLMGLDIGPDVPPVSKINLDMALGLVIGGEGEGMRRLVRDTCDLRVTLPMRGHVGSLNAATAGSVVLYAAWQARAWQGWDPDAGR